MEQIETNQIGKNTTYNIASFMQKIIKIIPKNVQLKTISSDDNKAVKIVAQANQYADLGYFVAQMKLQGVLANVKINKVNNASTIEVEIGGDLP
ncbi:Fimbrial assembly protein (PilN) [compost metagenome]